MSIQQYYNAIVRNGHGNAPTYGEVRQDLAKNPIDPRFYIAF